MKNLLTIVLLSFIVTTKAQNYSSGFTGDSKKDLGIGMTVGGVAFTTAAILEGGYQYGTYVTTYAGTPNTSPKQTYVIPPVWKQTPRNIMFCVGVTLTITGLITAISK